MFQEAWMLPPVLLLRPDLAKSMLQYRIRMINAARKRARQDGLKGAR